MPEHQYCSHLFSGLLAGLAGKPALAALPSSALPTLALSSPALPESALHSAACLAALCRPQATRRQSLPQSAAFEERWELTAASAGQKLGAIALGVANFLGVGALSVLLQNPMNVMALARNGMLWVTGAMPYLQVGGGLRPSIM